MIIKNEWCVFLKLCSPDTVQPRKQWTSMQDGQKMTRNFCQNIPVNLTKTSLTLSRANCIFSNAFSGWNARLLHESGGALRASPVRLLNRLSCGPPPSGCYPIHVAGLPGQASLPSALRAASLRLIPCSRAMRARSSYSYFSRYVPQPEDFLSRTCPTGVCRVSTWRSMV